MKNHLNYECGKPRMYACPYCMKTCSLKGNLKKHMILVHKEITDINKLITLT